MTASDPYRRGPLFFWRGHWRGKGSEEIEAGDRRPPPQSIIKLDMADYVSKEKRGRLGFVAHPESSGGEEDQDHYEDEDVPGLDDQSFERAHGGAGYSTEENP